MLDRVRVNANIATLGTSSVSQGHHNGVVNSAPQSKRIRYSVPRVLDCGVLVGGNLGRPGVRSCRIKTLYYNTRRAEPSWRLWCKSPIWKSIRRHTLAEEPLCRQCTIEGRTMAASHVGHIDPHLGQWLLFGYENT